MSPAERLCAAYERFRAAQQRRTVVGVQDTAAARELQEARRALDAIAVELHGAAPYRSTPVFARYADGRAASQLHFRLEEAAANGRWRRERGDTICGEVGAGAAAKLGAAPPCMVCLARMANAAAR